MDVKEITVSYGKTKNLGNYENMRVDAEMTVAIQDGEDVNEVFDKAQQEVKRQVHKEVGL